MHLQLDPDGAARLRRGLCVACLLSLFMPLSSVAAPTGVRARPSSAPPAAAPAAAPPPAGKGAELKTPEKQPLLAVPVPETPQQALTKVNLAEIKLLEALLSRTADNDPEKADIFWRYAGLCRELAKDKERQERALDAAILNAKENKQSAAQKQLEANQRRFKQVRIAWLDRAKNALVKAADGAAFSHYEKMDQVLAMAAYLLRNEQDEDAKSKALTENEKLRDEKVHQYYLRLVGQFPTSPLVGDAYFFLGEAALDGGHGAEALVYYDKAVRSPNLQPGWFGYALYKKGWAALSAQRSEDAKQSFLDAVRWAKQRPADRQSTELAKAAFAGFVRAFAQNDSFATAKDVFSKIDPELMPEMMRRLAAQLADNARYSEAIAAFEYLIQTDPDKQKVCDWRIEIVKQDRSQNGGRPVESTLSQIQKLLALPESSAPTAVASAPQAAGCTTKTQAVIQETVTQWHQEAFKTRTYSTAETTLHLYQVFARAFPRGPQAESTRFWMAELLFLMGSLRPEGNAFCEAAPIYSELLDKNAMVSRTEEMAWSRLVSWQGCLDEQDRQHPPATTEDPPLVRKTVDSFIDAALFYLTKIKAKDEDRAQVLYSASRLYVRRHEPALAIPLLEELIQKNPQHPAFTEAVALLLECFRQDPRINSDLGYLDTVVQRLKGLSTTLPKGAASDSLPGFKLTLLRKKAELLQSSNQALAAAKLFQSLAQEYASDPSAGDLWNNAAHAFHRAGLLDDALAAIRALSDKLPNYPRVPNLYYQGGLWLYDAARFKESLDWFALALARLPAAAPEAETALATSAFIRRLTAAPAEFLSLTAEWRKRFGGLLQHRARSREIALQRLAVLEAGHDEDNLQLEAKQALESWQPSDGVSQKVSIEIRLGLSLWRRSCPTAEQQGLCVTAAERVKVRACSTDSVLRPLLMPQPRDPQLVAAAQRHFAAALALSDAAAPGEATVEQAAAAKYVAMARFAAANAAFEDFLRFQTMPENLQKFTEWNGQLQEKRNSARSLYEAVIQTRQGTWALAAWSRLADMNQILVDSLMYAPIPKTPPVPRKGIRPKDWSQKFEDQYCDQIGKLVLPLDDSIGKMFLSCQTKAADLYMDNEWTQHCSAQLAKKQPVDFPLPEEILPPNFAVLSLSRALPDPAEIAALPIEQRDLLTPARNQLLTALPSGNNQDLPAVIAAAQHALVLDGTSVPAYRLLIASYLQVNPSDTTLPLLFATTPKDNAKLLLLQGQYQGSQHATSDAYVSFAKALKLDPQVLLARIWLGYLSIQVHSPVRALEHFEEVLKVTPEDTWALIGKGVALRELARPRDSEQAYRLSLKSQDLGTQCAARYDLGVLFRSFIEPTSAVRKNELLLAKGFFQDFVKDCHGTPEQQQKAAAWIAEIDQLIPPPPPSPPRAPARPGRKGHPPVSPQSSGRSKH